MDQLEEIAALKKVRDRAKWNTVLQVIDILLIQSVVFTITCCVVMVVDALK